MTPLGRAAAVSGWDGGCAGDERGWLQHPERLAEREECTLLAVIRSYQPNAR